VRIVVDVRYFEANILYWYQFKRQGNQNQMSSNDSMMTYLLLGALIGYLVATKSQKWVGAEGDDAVVSPSIFGSAPAVTSSSVPKFAPAAPASGPRRGAARKSAPTPIFKPAAPQPKAEPKAEPKAQPKAEAQPKIQPKAQPKALKSSNWFGGNDITIPEITVNDGAVRPLQPGLR
jgi:outer membrane biosynthesis protein TonB